MNEIGSAYIEQGWQCPICKAVMSPKEKVCINCKGKDKEVAVTYSEYDIDNSGTYIPNYNKTISYEFNNLLNSFDEEFNKIFKENN
ncbi:hypothetical protein [uncultured Clostridium sp.]|uniref:hypothetical protein n=1 Tax=uncultured Clostridium sp. TaxID=59620 RepID=UPI002626538F|nr:hypothetical protein [uncultured Clostridium sp.]